MKKLKTHIQVTGTDSEGRVISFNVQLRTDDGNGALSWRTRSGTMFHGDRTTAQVGDIAPWELAHIRSALVTVKGVH